MRIGLDYRAATVAPKSGIGRQVQALEQALLARPGDELVRFSEAPLAHAQRQTASCPPWGSPLDGLHRPKVRLKFESRFLPRLPAKGSGRPLYCNREHGPASRQKTLRHAICTGSS